MREQDPAPLTFISADGAVCDLETGVCAPPTAEDPQAI